MHEASRTADSVAIGPEASLLRHVAMLEFPLNSSINLPSYYLQLLPVVEMNSVLERTKLAWRRSKGRQLDSTGHSNLSPEPCVLDTTMTPNSETSSLDTAAAQGKDIAPLSLWDNAYDSLRGKESELLRRYEELLSREMTPDQNAWSEAESKQTHMQDSRARQGNLEHIIRSGLRRMDETKTRYVIFGLEFVPRDQVAGVSKSVKSMKLLVDEAVKASPEASIVWAGICTILPILTSPAAADEANRDGFVYVTSRMRFYNELEYLLRSLGDVGDYSFKAEVNQRFIELYEHIVLFQIKTVLRFYDTRLRRLREDVISHGMWNQMLLRLKDLEKAFDADLQKISGLSSKWELEKIRSSLDDFTANLSGILNVLVRSCESSAAPVFRHHGSGQQLNYVGSVHNSSMGSGSHFNGAVFSAPVYFR